jgi:hypothetical protein
VVGIRTPERSLTSLAVGVVLASLDVFYPSSGGHHLVSFMNSVDVDVFEGVIEVVRLGVEEGVKVADGVIIDGPSHSKE